jgi:hypothetical protein
VQARLALGNRRRAGEGNANIAAALVGKIFDDRGHPMSPVSARRGARTYRYYVSQAAIRRDRGEAGSVRRIPAYAIEGLIESELTTRGREGEPCIRRVVISDTVIEMTFSATTGGDGPAAGDIVSIAAKLKTWGGAKQLIGDDGQSLTRSEPDEALLRAIARGKRWEAQIASGERLGANDIAAAERLQSRYVDKILKLAWLPPDMVERVAAGARLRDDSLTELIERNLPLSWHDQRQLVALV